MCLSHTHTLTMTQTHTQAPCISLPLSQTLSHTHHTSKLSDNSLQRTPTKHRCIHPLTHSYTRTNHDVPLVLHGFNVEGSFLRPTHLNDSLNIFIIQQNGDHVSQKRHHHFPRNSIYVIARRMFRSNLRTIPISLLCGVIV